VPPGSNLASAAAVVKSLVFDARTRAVPARDSNNRRRSVAL
jgi:hypothetical protein